MAKTLLDKIWDDHVVADLGDGWDLMHVDRHLLHDLSGALAFDEMAARGLPVASPELCFATVDHAISTMPGRTARTFERGARLYDRMKAGVTKAGIRLFDAGTGGQGIVHVMAPELGLVLPGMVLICADSHTCTNGGLGALAFGVGTLECVHALATQTLRLQRPGTMRVTLEGQLARGVSPKDVILHVIARLGVAAGVGKAVEFDGPAVATMEMEGRLTICNLAVELGARSGLIAPDDVTFAYLAGRPFAPTGEAFDRAVVQWRGLASDADAHFDRSVSIDVGQVQPTITWGTSPEQAIGVNEPVPDPASGIDARARADMCAALDYMGLEPGRPLAGRKVDRVFIGSCANSRLSDLREAAAIVRGRRKATNVAAWVVPGSVAVKSAAEAEGLDRVFREAGFEWREPGCSMCVAANGELVAPGERCVSTSNRNFVGRQGPGARTHLASPAMAAAAAIAGAIADVRTI
ncbi:3-isopropylmalate dehydratase large subunit [Novosphingobium sp. SG707]|uniref:3-isopropylmalate dehydratase large subunit n=1 Tax=Novosphingobium sp. SG707 TaxID=2586996 RepID=UPI00144625BC|nr:3-isopropylmalate dehydratase large subunit [Novosphingobium sp. SG707]NKJ00964.1 3-isopropylmalate/(R)-2-methylmalate dehydratase large subunit [Novosphingobium sp. SG707]